MYTHMYKHIFTVYTTTQMYTVYIIGGAQDNQLEIILEEVKDLNEVWRELSSIWVQVRGSCC